MRYKASHRHKWTKLFLREHNKVLGLIWYGRGTYVNGYLDVEPGRILADCPPPSPLVTRSTQLTGLHTPWSPILALVTMLLVFCDTQSATLSVSRNLSAALRWAKSCEKCNTEIRKEPRTELLAESALPRRSDWQREKSKRAQKFPFLGWLSRIFAGQSKVRGSTALQLFVSLVKKCTRNFKTNQIQNYSLFIAVKRERSRS